MSEILTLNLKSQVLKADSRGRDYWDVVTETRKVRADKTLILICDMWDDHRLTGSAERVAEMAPRMNKVLKAARAKGVHIVHGPNDCMDFYVGTKARQRMIDSPHVQPPAPIEHDDPPLPTDHSVTASDTFTIDRQGSFHHPWTRQIDLLEIDESRDGVSVSGSEIYNYMRLHGLEQYLIMGVHTNMCILNRTFGIKQMVRWGVPTALVRDLTDATYSPRRPPYVSQAEGTRLIVEYIEKFWAPTVASSDLTA